MPNAQSSRLPRRGDPLLRHRADRRTLFWSLGLFPAVPFLGLANPHLSLWLTPLALYLGYSAGVLSHYHVHRGVFVSAALNRWYSVWLSGFYGFPLFSWVPTHNQNHHKHTDGPGDRTSTRRSGKPDSLWQALLYPSRSSVWQLPAVLKAVTRARGRNRREMVLQTAATVCFPLAYGSLSVGLHGGPGWVPFLTLVLAPALFAPWSMMFTNYIQHVGCDPSSANNHSRNFVGRVENWFVFDAGLHTVHHDCPGLHWSELRDAHERRVESIDPRLNERNIFAFLFNRYVLGRPLYRNSAA